MQFRDNSTGLNNKLFRSFFYYVLSLVAVSLMLTACSSGADKYPGISVNISKSPSANLALDKVDDLIIEVDNQGEKTITYLMIKIIFKNQEEILHKIDLTPIWADEKMYRLDPGGNKNKYKPLEPDKKLSYGVDLTSLSFLNSEAQARLERNWNDLTIQTRIIKVKFDV